MEINSEIIQQALNNGIYKPYKSSVSCAICTMPKGYTPSKTDDNPNSIWEKFLREKHTYNNSIKNTDVNKEITNQDEKIIRLKQELKREKIRENREQQDKLNWLSLF